MQPARYPMLFQLLTPLLAHPDPLAGGISYQLNPSLATPGTSLSFRSAFSMSSAVCSLPCHRDPAMQPLHCALSPKRNIAHHTEILHNVFKSIKFSLLLTPLHNLMPIITWKRKFYLQCNYAILWPPFHQTHPSVWYTFTHLSQCPKEWFAPFESKEGEAQGHSQTWGMTRREVQLSQFSCARCTMLFPYHTCVFFEKVTATRNNNNKLYLVSCSDKTGNSS